MLLSKLQAAAVAQGASSTAIGRATGAVSAMAGTRVRNIERTGRAHLRQATKVL